MRRRSTAGKKLTLGNPQCPCCLRIAQSLLDRLRFLAQQIGNATRAQRSMGRDCGGHINSMPQAGQRNVCPCASSGAANCREQLKHETVILIAPAKKAFSPLNFYLGAESEKVKPQFPFAPSQVLARWRARRGNWEDGRKGGDALHPIQRHVERNRRMRQCAGAIRSTPVRAISPIVASETPPEASSSTAGASSFRSATAVCNSSKLILSNSTISGFAARTARHCASESTSTSTIIARRGSSVGKFSRANCRARRTASAGKMRFAGPAAAERQMVVFDQNRVE